jgi:hypothetical protein
MYLRTGGSQPMTEAERRTAGEFLKSRGATQPCPRCRHSLFYVLDHVDLPLPSPPNVIGFSGSIPTVLTACANCGFVAMHVIGLEGQ